MKEKVIHGFKCRDNSTTQNRVSWCGLNDNGTHMMQIINITCKKCIKAMQNVQKRRG